jgi:hypothetical protein
VPAKNKKKVSMIGILKKACVNFEAPIQVQGMFGANFPDKVKGHYFWFLGAETVLNQTTGKLTGSIKNGSVFDVQTEIGPSEPIVPSGNDVFEEDKSYPRMKQGAFEIESRKGHGTKDARSRKE